MIGSGGGQIKVRRVSNMMRQLVWVAIAGLLLACDKKAPDQIPDTAASPLTQEDTVPDKPWPPLREDNKPLSLAPDLLASNYFVVLDGSGSMSQRGCSGSNSKMNVAKKSLAEFAKVVHPDANLGLLVFSRHGVEEVLPLGTQNRDNFVNEVRRVIPGGGTPLKTSLEKGYETLTEQSRRQLGYGEYHLVVVTDGEANSGEDPTEIVKTIIQDSPVLVHTIGFCINDRHSLNQPGRTLYKAANNPKALSQGLQAVLAEAPTFTVGEFKAETP